MTPSQESSRNMLILSMVIFGTVGIFRRFIPAPSSHIALIRGIIGTVVLIGYMLMTKQSIDRAAVRKNFWALLYSGAAIGFNWILLFEAYCYTSVATATLCYYLAPILVIIGASIILKERLSMRKILCTAAALVGMVFVSGVLETGISSIYEMKGILYGLGAAVLYASVILTNKQMPDIPALDKTIFQLGFASLVLLPYVLLTEGFDEPLEGFGIVLLIIVGVVHTGIAYLLYFGSMKNLKAHTVAILSYIDPVLAILLSALLLREPMSIGSAVGAVLILGAAYISERE